LRIGNWLAVGGIAIWAVWLLVYGKPPAVSAVAAAPLLETHSDPNAACAKCHQAIYDRYQKTPMANASGLAADGFLPGSFTHEGSGVSYRMAERDGRVYLDFSRETPLGAAHGTEDDRSLNGQRELKYFLGSGKRGRTYLFDQDGYWFEIPVNWYGKKRVWDMAPNYQNAREMPLTLPVDPGCLRCHGSNAQPSLPEARNRYRGVPFLENGITCTACHGDATAHLASGGHTAMMKLGELRPVRRDSICLSCHLEGQEAVAHQGKRLVDFRPGESIFDYASYFVRQESLGERATSQWEALLESGCKRGVGDKLTCTTCHDPHGSPVPAGRVAFYRAKCLECHDAEAAGKLESGTAGFRAVAQKGFAATHHPENQDCTSCHMPRAKAEDIAHEQVTDHRIPRVLRQPANKEQSVIGSDAGALVAIGTSAGVAGASSGRDLGVAYALEALQGDKAAGERALELLRQAEALPGSDADWELHERLGFLDQLVGDKDAAAREYALALAANPYDSVAAGNLALLKAGDRQYGAAIDLLQRAFEEDPVQLKAGMNLAIMQCGFGKKEAALGTLDRILAFSPDYGQARDFAREIRSGRNGCGSH
jgi:predicted CXXCH cytochrome family protein